MLDVWSSDVPFYPCRRLVMHLAYRQDHPSPYRLLLRCPYFCKSESNIPYPYFFVLNTALEGDLVFRLRLFRRRNSLYLVHSCSVYRITSQIKYMFSKCLLTGTFCFLMSTQSSSLTYFHVLVKQRISIILLMPRSLGMNQP